MSQFFEGPQSAEFALQEPSRGGEKLARLLADVRVDQAGVGVGEDVQTGSVLHVAALHVDMAGVPSHVPLRRAGWGSGLEMPVPEQDGQVGFFFGYDPAVDTGRLALRYGTIPPQPTVFTHSTRDASVFTEVLVPVDGLGKTEMGRRNLEWGGQAGVLALDGFRTAPAGITAQFDQYENTPNGILTRPFLLRAGVPVTQVGQNGRTTAFDIRVFEAPETNRPSRQAAPTSRVTGTTQIQGGTVRDGNYSSVGVEAGAATRVPEAVVSGSGGTLRYRQLHAAMRINLVSQ